MAKPQHIAIQLGGYSYYSKKYKIRLDEVYRRSFFKIKDLLDFQIDSNIPIVTVGVLSTKVKDFSDFSLIMDHLIEFLEMLKTYNRLFKDKVKVSIHGKWYDLPGRVVESLKEILEETKDYDSYFLNLCINYDGQQEIVDACKILSRRVKAGRLEPENISEKDIRDNIYSSYFLPPDLVIRTGRDRVTKGFLLWESTKSHMHFSNSSWLEFSDFHLRRAIDEWNHYR